MLFAANCGNIIRRYCFAAEYALVAQPVEHLTFNQRARDSSSLERTKIPRRIVRFLVGFSFYTPFARSLHGFCTVRIFRVRWSKSVNYSAIRAIFCNSGQQSQAKLRFYRGVCVLQKLQQSRHGDGRFCFNRGSLPRCCSRLVEAFLEPFTQLLAGILLDVCIGVDQQISTGVTCCSLYGFHITAGDHQLVGRTGMPQAMEHDAGELRMLPPTRRTRNNACWEIPIPFKSAPSRHRLRDGIAE